MARVEADPVATTEWWRIAASRSAHIGDRVYLFKQGNGPRGIFGVGSIVDGPKLTSTPSDPELRPRACIRFDKLIDPTKGFLLRLDEIIDIIPPKSITAIASGTRVEEAFAAELEKRLAPWLTPVGRAIESEQADDAAFDPDSVGDERERALRAICIRRGQPLFRAALLNAYGKRCVITGCAVEDVLEAAHVSPYKGPLTNHVTNGLLLRADLHTLFDCDLLGIDPQTRRVVTANSLNGSAYEKLAGRLIRAPKNEAHGPTTKNLQKRFERFRAL